MRLGGEAAHLVDVWDDTTLQEAVEWARENNLPVIMIGDGSNIIWKDEGFGGLVICNKIMHYQEDPVDEKTIHIHIGAGENWDRVVARTVAKGLTGIEALSLIPGTAGATPIQNVGAYGQEIADTLVSFDAYDNETKQFVTIPAADCDFGYRTSRLNTTDRGRFYITKLKLRLRYGNPTPPYYPALQNYLDNHGVTKPTSRALRDAVIAIRQAKLPDVTQVANCGSFFANPIVDQEKFAGLRKDYPAIPGWETPIRERKLIKIPAAWLIEQAGFKSFHDPESGMGTWPEQPLVLVNERAETTAQLVVFSARIVKAIELEFGILLQREPELLPS
ncbi:hypothetical protein ABW20_dc0103440 [Dactylellina cionopaga]|nr:hypothetical protein ABW20_dc0103440 [Dactylellina cionopaga]